MGIVNIAPVTRAGMRLLISLYGMSESGKTLSALLLAQGMEPDPAKRGLLDTEGGQRGRAYVDHIDGGYLYGTLTPPFTPERYVQAIAEFESAGVNVLVIDSISHIWTAEGGILEMVENATEKNDMAKWKGPKRRLQKATGRILRGDMHIIVCARGKQPMVEEVDAVTGRKKYVAGPIVPVQEKGLWFDLTVIAQMLGDGHFTIAKPQGKCPGPLRPVFSGHEVIGVEMGRQLAAWAMSTGGKSPEQRALEVDATEAAEVGVESLKTFLAGLTDHQRASLRPKADNYRSIAKAADAEKARQDDERKAAALEAGSVGNPFSSQTDSTATTGISEAATRAMTDLRACANEAELSAAWEAMPLDVCRELGAGVLDEIRATFREF